MSVPHFTLEDEQILDNQDFGDYLQNYADRYSLNEEDDDANSDPVMHFPQFGGFHPPPAMNIPHIPQPQNANHGTAPVSYFVENNMVPPPGENGPVANNPQSLWPDYTFHATMDFGDME